MNKIYINGKYYNQKRNDIHIEIISEKIPLIVDPVKNKIPYISVARNINIILNNKAYPVMHMEQKYGDTFLEIKNNI